MLCRSWTNAGRPPLPSDGQMGFNRTSRVFEWWDASLSTWVTLGGGGAGTPDVAPITLGFQDFFPESDPAWQGGGGAFQVGSPAWGQTIGWALPPGVDTGIVATTVLPSNLDLSRNPVVQVVLDDGGGGSNVNFWALEIALSEESCGGPAVSGVLGPFPGMNPANVPDASNQTQCIVFTGSIPWYGSSGPVILSIRRRGTTDPAPNPVQIIGASLEFPSAA